jgi:outer membrane protein assembly factor BamA
MKIPGVATLLLLASAASSAQAMDEPRLLVQDVECRGNHSTSCAFIRSHLNLAAGMPLDEAEIRNAQLRLSSLRNFESIDVRLERGAQRNAAIVVIEVTEASPLTTEALAGLSSRRDSTRSVFAGRLAHQNLFGAGKTIDLSALAITPLAGDGHDEDYEIHQRYADPNLFGSERYFGIARVSWINLFQRDIHGNFSSFESAEFDFRIGRRFGDFSYFTVGITYRLHPTWVVGEWDLGGDTDFDFAVRQRRTGTSLIYGWNSEDDLYFPTQGDSFHIGVGRDFGANSPAYRSYRSHIQYRKTWSLDDSFLTLKVAGSPSPEYRTTFEESQLLSVSYARPFKASDNLKRGRWYIEPGISDTRYYTPQGDRIYEVGIKAGVRLDTTAFGIVDLYLMGGQDLQR